MEMIRKLHEKLLEHADSNGIIKRKKMFYIISINFNYIKGQIVKELVKQNLLKKVNMQKLKLSKKDKEKEDDL